MLLTLISLTAVETSCKWPDLELRFIWDIICKRQMSSFFIILFKNIAAKFLSARKKCSNNDHFEFKNHTTANKLKTFEWFLLKNSN